MYDDDDDDDDDDDATIYASATTANEVIESLAVGVGLFWNGWPVINWS